MQTAAQVPIATPPTPMNAKSNPLVTTSFIIGLILVVPMLFTLIAGIIGTRVHIETGFPLIYIRSLILYPMGITALIGLFSAVIGITRMKLTPGPHPYGVAVVGFMLCFAGFSYLLFAVMNGFGSSIGNLVRVLQ